MISIITTAPSTIDATSGMGKYLLNVAAVDSTTTLFSRLVGLSVAWGDGLTSSIPFVAGGTLTVAMTHTYPPGDYAVVITAVNARYPVADSTTESLEIEVIGPPMASTDLGVVYGPILPSDTGTPNATDWDFNLGKDAAILRSSVKMLLNTTFGERLMEPTYGTNLQTMIFEPLDLGVLGGRVSEEVNRACQLWEPRVALLTCRVDQPDNSSMRANLVFLSKLDQTTFDLQLVFTQG